MADQGQNQGGNPANPAQQQPSQQFIKPEQITAQNFPMFNADVLGKYRNGFTQLYAAMNSHQVGSDMHTQALNKLREANSKLVTQLRIHKQQQRGQQGSPQQQQQQQQQGPPQQAYQHQVAQQQAAQQQAAQQQAAQQQAAQQHAAQQQAQQQRAQQAQQQQANQQAPQRPNSQGQPQIPQQQQQPQQQNMVSANSLKPPDELPPDIKAKVEKANLAHPANYPAAGIEKWHAEALKRYGDALYQKRTARMGIAQCDRLIAQAQVQNEEARPEVVAKKKEFQKTAAESDSFIQKLSALQTQAGHQTTIWDEEENGSASNLNGGGEGQQARPASSQAATSGAPAQGMASTANSQQQQQLLLQQQQQQARQGQGPNAPPLPMQQNQASQPNQQQNFNARQPQNPAQGASAAQNQSRPPSQPVGAGGPNGEPPVPLSHQEAIARASKTWTGGQGQQQQQQSQQNPQQQQAQQPQQTGATTSNLGQMPNATDVDKKPDKAMPINKNFNPTTPQPVSVPAPRPTLAGSNNGPLGMMGQPAIQKPEPYLLQGPGDRVLDKKKLDELVRQVTGGGGADGETLHPEVEESILQLADEFIENVVSSACRLAKLRGSASLEVRDIQLILERQYNIRIPGYSTDEVRTVRKIQPAAGYLQKMNAVQAAKVMNGRTDI